jgi:hypothetical protein
MFSPVAAMMKALRLSVNSTQVVTLRRAESFRDNRHRRTTTTAFPPEMSMLVVPRTLETVTNVALLAAAITVVTLSIEPRLRTAARPSEPYRVGDRVVPTAELRFDKPTFVLATSSSCRYCTASMPFYARLIAAGGPVIAVTSEPLADNLKYLTSHGVSPIKVVSAAANGLRFRATPTLLLVDTGGIVQGVWFGKQNEQGEKDILGRLR